MKALKELNNRTLKNRKNLESSNKGVVDKANELLLNPRDILEDTGAIYIREVRSSY